MSAPVSRDDRSYITNVLQRLHDRGVVDLDAPAREAIPFLEKKIRALRSVDEDDWWWIFVGSLDDDGEVYFFFGIGSD